MARESRTVKLNDRALDIFILMRTTMTTKVNNKNIFIFLVYFRNQNIQNHLKRLKNMGSDHGQKANEGESFYRQFAEHR